MSRKRYLRGRAPAEGTPIAIDYLRQYVANETNKAKAVVRLLGCSERTAKRLLSVKHPYTARLKVVWAHRICSAVGKPPVHVLGPKGAKMFPQAIIGWHNAKSKPESMERAADCGALVALQAALQYGLSGHYTVSFAQGWARKVIIYLSGFPEMAQSANAFHQIVIVAVMEADGKERMRVRHIKPGETGVRGNDLLTPELLIRIIQRIYALDKDHATKLLRRGN